MQVGGKKREPDDKLYNTHEVLRHKVARGNTILYVHDTEKNLLSYHCVVFALRKFTGGMGDEDEDQPDSNKTWLNYFLKPLGKYRPGHTVWKNQDFSVIQILREINYRCCRSSKKASLAIVRASKSAKIHKKSKFKTSNCVKMADFAL